MTIWQREILRNLMLLTNELGGSLDYTATHYNKLRDRQKSLMQCSTIIYGVLCDHPNNEERDADKKRAEEALEKIRELTKIVYPDRSGELQKIFPHQE